MGSLATQSQKGMAYLIIGFRYDCEVREMTKGTINHYTWCVNHFLKFLKSEEIAYEAVTVKTLRAYLEHLKSKSSKFSTLDNAFSGIGAFYDYLVFEGLIPSNPVPTFRRRYLKRYNRYGDRAQRKLLSIEEMSRLVGSIVDPRDKAIVVLLAKTGIRRGELMSLDVESIDWKDGSIMLRPTPKRRNRVVFFDYECEYALKRWVALRSKYSPDTPSLFISYEGFGRIRRSALGTVITKHARALGFHDPYSRRLEDHYGAHCFRHFFTTHMIRNGMPRSYVKELRGDSVREGIDFYSRIDREELKRSYLECVPKLGV